jgi:Domain of unknown function (DUF4838)/Carbohydrate family 9 binding domain-like
MTNRVVFNVGGAVVALALSLVLGQSAWGESFIVKDGQPQAEIIIAEKPPRSVPLAVSELQEFIKKISGAQLPVVTKETEKYPVKIYIGKSSYTDKLGITDKGLKYGAFNMISGKNYLALVGNDANVVFTEPYGRGGRDEKARVTKEWDKLTGEKWGAPMLSTHRRYAPALGVYYDDEKGSLNAVYQFLRDLGCRWYFPGEIGEIIPQMKTIALPKVKKTIKPDFASRHLLYYYNEFWMARKGIPKGIEDVKWQLRLGVAHYAPVLGPGLGHGSMAVHSREEVKKAHPEYYALWRGKRATVHQGNYGAGCLSSQGLFEQNVKYVRFMFDHYDLPAISVAPADGYGSLCECKLCEGKGTPERGFTGSLSDYVWDYTNRVAKEVYKTHPDKYITCIAYSTYLQPPKKIKKLSPNIIVGFCYWRSQLAIPSERKRLRDVRNAWLKKLPSKKVFIWDYHRYHMPGRKYESVPVIFPHHIAEDLKDLKGVSLGDHIEIYRNHTTHDNAGNVLAGDQINCYVNSRLLWDVDQNVDKMLDEYYEKYYGPASKQMKTFYEYCEANWTRTIRDVTVIDRMYELIDLAQKATGKDTVYHVRVTMMIDYMARMKQLRARLNMGRGDNPKARVYDRPKGSIVVDGKLNDAAWQKLPLYYLRDLETGAEPRHKTSFRVAWAGDSLYFAITCKDSDIAGMKVFGKKIDDPAIWKGDAIELLLETQTHEYYQITIDPAGMMADVDRKDNINTKWSSAIEAASQIGKDQWTLEVRIPVAGDMAAEIDPTLGVSGRKPSKTYPWHFNLCRQRLRERSKELTAFSPTGKPDFHKVPKFGQLQAAF